jgi:hypothetical protein
MMTDLYMDELDPVTSIADTDLIHIERDPGGTPEDVTISWANFKTALNSEYQIAVTVASNNITATLKDRDGNNPSATVPVRVKIGNTVRTVTSALSVTKNAGTNWCNAGGAELATKEIDYFVYLGYNATDGVVIGFSRIPYAKIYSDFSTTNTDEKYCAISTITNAAAGDAYNVIGRFAATLSAGAGYTWSVPTFTASNLVHRPIYETRILTWQPVYSASASMTYTSVTTDIAEYKITERALSFEFEAHGTTGGTPNLTIYATCPFEVRNVAQQPAVTAWVLDTGSAGIGAFAYFNASTPDQLAFRRYDSANWGAGAGRYINGNGKYFI